jgi:hypothetical protein
MKVLQPVQWKLSKCVKELKELRKLLLGSSALSERDEILPFFKERLHLSAFVGSFHEDLLNYNLVAHEYNLFGDFMCDLVVGDSANKGYGFVEFEDAAPNSIFVKKKGKASLEWAPRFERGFSQLIDWFYKLDDMEKTAEFAGRFGAPVVKYFGLLVVGKDESLKDKEARRLNWRQDKTLVNSNKIKCVTFDQLHDLLVERAKAMSQLAET